MSDGKIITPGRIGPKDHLCSRCASRVPMTLGVPSLINQPGGQTIHSVEPVAVLACSHGLVTGPGALTALVVECGAFNEGFDVGEGDLPEGEEPEDDDSEEG